MSSLATASLMVPDFLRAYQFNTLPQTTNKVLVIIQLTGGNDALNTIIPYRNDLYYRNRPTLAIQRDKAFSLTDDVGLHPAFTGLKGLYDDGRLSIINGVGYPEPNRSHFRSMDIWQTASGAKDNETTGWIGRYLDNMDATANEHNTLAMELDDTLSLALKGDDRKGIAVRDINQFHNATANSYFKQLAAHEDEHNEKMAGYLYKTLRESTSAADYIFAQSKKYSSRQVYPDTAIGKRLKTIGSLIVANTDTRVYYLSHGSFDTHVNQQDRQNKLFKELDEAVTALYNDIKNNNRENDVLIMTFSEFGRRVAQNGSNGTDHGTAGNMFFIGGGLKKPGLYNNIPSLADLDAGDLKYEIDFRRVYATVMDKWMSTNPRDILGKRFDGLGFI